MIAYVGDSPQLPAGAVDDRAYLQTARSRISLAAMTGWSEYFVHDAAMLARGSVEVSMQGFSMHHHGFYTYAPGNAVPLLASGAGNEDGMR